MNPEQHQKSQELFERLRDLLTAEREAVLLAECASDAELRETVSNLLAADDALPAGFLSEPALKTAARWLTPAACDEPPLEDGARLRQYRLVRAIGTGGMGTVYEAVDERLERAVAIKVLAPGALQNPEMLQRFQQEPRAVSLLNHPNIVSVYDVAEEGGRHFLVTGLVPGRRSGLSSTRGPSNPSWSRTSGSRSPRRWKRRTRPTWCIATSSRRMW